MLELEGRLHQPRFSVKELVHGPALRVVDAESEVRFPGMHVAIIELPGERLKWHSLVVDQDGLLLVREDLTRPGPPLEGRYYPSITCGMGCVYPEQIVPTVLNFCALGKEYRPWVESIWTQKARIAAQNLDRSHITILTADY